MKKPKMLTQAGILVVHKGDREFLQLQGKFTHKTQSELSSTAWVGLSLARRKEATFQWKEKYEQMLRHEEEVEGESGSVS